MTSTESTEPIDAYQVGPYAYHDLRDIRKRYPLLHKKDRTTKKFIKAANIPDKHWMYVRLVKGVWVPSDGTSTRVDKVFIRMYFFNRRLLPSIPVVPKYPPLPEEVVLDDEEKFHDADGNACYIKVVGKRDENQIRFCVDDVAEIFELDRLADTITNKSSTFEEHEHYERFSVASSDTNGNSIRTVLYLTYEGILKVLFASRSQSTKPFRVWATKILFTVQMGSRAQKRQLASNLVTLDCKTIKALQNATSGDTPCIYLLILGTGKQLRDGMSLDSKYKDTDLVCKYGRTSKLEKRFAQHEAIYNEIDGCELRLTYHAYVDVRYGPEAEAMIRLLMNDLEMHLKYENFKELVVIPKKMMKRVTNEYDVVSKLYRGCLKEVVAENQDLRKDNKIQESEYRTKIAEKEIELSDKNTELAKKDVELSKKDVIVANLEKELAIAQMRLKHATKKAKR